MRIKEIGKKFKEFDYKKLLNTKAFLIVGCITLVGIAILVNTLVSGGAEDVLNNESGKILGNSVLVDNNTSADDVIADENEQGDFFAASAINRQNTRDDALEVLQQIAENPDALPDAKEDALLDIAAIVDDMNAESNIETLIKAKGFAECVAVISGENCSVIVQSDGLLANELTQILEIIYDQAGIVPDNVTVIEK
ncbi:MAG: hypothetical protein A2Y15_04945 [Clostridiales bacterium GWF2_36_10]|nr:MAG: hypothetical protein A2Y15_04945 [Clostridiales bacterium GWF2_36_10]HAN21098.1 hypothetical protein [Clostridiales bacterium]